MCVYHSAREKDNKLKCPNCGGNLLEDGIERICEKCEKHFSLVTDELLEVEYKSPHSYLKCPFSEIVAKEKSG